MSCLRASTAVSAVCWLTMVGSISAQPAGRNPSIQGVKVGAFEMDVATSYTEADGLPSVDVHALAVEKSGAVFAGTANGLAVYKDGRWSKVPGIAGPVRLVVPDGENVLIATKDKIVSANAAGPLEFSVGFPEGVKPEAVRCLSGGSKKMIGATFGIYEWISNQWRSVDAFNKLYGTKDNVNQIATSDTKPPFVATTSGLISFNNPIWFSYSPTEGTRSWSPHHVRGVTFDSLDQLWFASPQGAGVKTKDGWRLFTGYEGLPYDDFTCVAAGPKGVWFGTTMGAIRYEDGQWFYRQGRSWLPDDKVRSIAVGPDGTAWFATSKGVGSISRRTITLAEKAKFFESEIDKYHRRTPFGYVLGVSLKTPGDKSSFQQHDSDNDGLWTSMYGAGEAFAFAATKDPKAKERAKNAFEAVRFLSQVTQGGSNPAPKGFPARTILPTSGPNPNETHYTAEKDRREQVKDPLWKVIVPRWPTSADGKWYWKTDTSSDELDGHYFLYGLMYDLVAETEEEKARVRDVVTAMTDHLIDHDFELVDHDGKPTRWGRFSPKVLNGDILVNCRGLNSLSLLSYIKVAEHVTNGGKKYTDAYNSLIKDHYYATNLLHAKAQSGPGTGNQSDDEMAFMCYYHLIKYEKDPALLSKYYRSLATYWSFEEPERCPLFNFIYLATYKGGAGGRMQSSAKATAEHIEESIDSLKRLPLDRVHWDHKNSHRKDIVLLRGFWGTWGGRKRGHLRNGKVLPIDERFVEHWNHDPWHLDTGGNGHGLADGNAFLLPYYMGLYHGFIIEPVGK